MIREVPQGMRPQPEPAAGRPVASGEAWLARGGGDDARAKGRSLWERLNPRHRRALLALARALALRQSQARLPDHLRARLAAIVEDLERIALRVECLIAEWRAGRGNVPPANRKG